MEIVAWRRLQERVRAVGIWPTLQYAIGTKLMLWLGVRINYVLEYGGETTHSGSGTFPAVSCFVMASMDDFSDQDREKLRAYGGGELLERFGRRFSKGLRCIVARARENEVTSLGWFMEAPSAFRDSGYHGMLIEDCFTLPEFRGRGIVRSLIRFGVAELKGYAQNEPLRIFMQCSVFNGSSLRAIRKCGFRQAAITYSFRHRTWARPIHTGKNNG